MWRSVTCARPAGSALLVGWVGAVTAAATAALAAGRERRGRHDEQPGRGIEVARFPGRDRVIVRSLDRGVRLLVWRLRDLVHHRSVVRRNLPRACHRARVRSPPVGDLSEATAVEGGQRFVTGSFDDPVLDACRLLVLADLPSFPAAIRRHPRTLNTWIAPSLDLSVQFHRVESLGDWLLLIGRAPVAHRGLMSFRSEVWTADDTIAATGSGQLLTRPTPPPAPAAER